MDLNCSCSREKLIYSSAGVSHSQIDYIIIGEYSFRLRKTGRGALDFCLTPFFAKGVKRQIIISKSRAQLSLTLPDLLCVTMFAAESELDEVRVALGVLSPAPPVPRWLTEFVAEHTE